MVVVVDDVIAAVVLLIARGAFFEVIVVEAGLELRYPDDWVTVTVVVTQLVRVTWHCCAEVVFGKV
jgi:hypothetical protein